MKRYKLLKDLPYAKAGEILELWSDGTMVFKDPSIEPRFNKQNVRMFPLWFEEIESYWYITQDGCISSTADTLIVDAHKEIGNCFETCEEAEKHLRWLKARAVLLEDTKGFKPDWTNDNQLKYNVYYDYSLKLLNWYSFYDITDKQLYFKTKEDVKISIKNHEKEWKIYLGIE